MISGDKRLLKEGSDASRRLALQRETVKQLDFFGYKGVLSGPIGFIQILYKAITEGYDVITSQDPFFRGLLAWIAARLSGTQFNVQVHADMTTQHFIKRAIARFVLPHADSVRVVSERVRQQVQAMGVRVPTTVLPVFINLERFKNIKRTPDEKPLILWVGRFENEKDPFLAIEIFEKAQKTVPDAKLIMLGEGSLEERLKITASGLSVEFPGWQDTLSYLARAHVVLSTSRAESWGASIVEALAAGVPVVAPDVGIAKEAGATIASKEELASVVISVLKQKQQGELKLRVLTENEWVEKWEKSLYA